MRAPPSRGAVAPTLEADVVTDSQQSTGQTPAEGAGSAPGGSRVGSVRFYLVRFRVYLALLVLILAVGLPIAFTPSLRTRLVVRYSRLRAAMAGTRNTLPVVAGVGENPRPFPPEFERPIPEKPRLPVFPARQGPVDLTSQVIRPGQPPVLRPAPPPAKAAGPPEEPAAAPVPAPTTDAESGAAEPAYRQGDAEKEAFDLLLAESAAVKAIVGGSNPAFRFKGWAAAKREDDVFWVRLTLSPEQGADADYIWQVRVVAKQVTALNFNARSLPR